MATSKFFALVLVAVVCTALAADLRGNRGRSEAASAKNLVRQRQRSSRAQALQVTSVGVAPGLAKVNQAIGREELGGSCDVAASAIWNLLCGFPYSPQAGKSWEAFMPRGIQANDPQYNYHKAIATMMARDNKDKVPGQIVDVTAQMVAGAWPDTYYMGVGDRNAIDHWFVAEVYDEGNTRMVQLYQAFQGGGSKYTLKEYMDPAHNQNQHLPTWANGNNPVTLANLATEIGRFLTPATTTAAYHNLFCATQTVGDTQHPRLVALQPPYGAERAHAIQQINPKDPNAGKKKPHRHAFEW
jgi:hypothetical protein